MNLGFLAQERPARNALTVVVNCVNPTRKPVADAMRSSARPARRSIKSSTRSLHTENVENEKGLKLRTLANYAEWPSGQAGFSISVLSIVHLSSALCPAIATIRPYRSCLPHG